MAAFRCRVFLLVSLTLFALINAKPVDEAAGDDKSGKEKVPAEAKPTVDMKGKPEAEKRVADAEEPVEAKISEGAKKPEEGKKPEEKPAEDKKEKPKADEKKPDEKKAADKKTEEKKADEKKPAEAKKAEEKNQAEQKPTFLKPIGEEDEKPEISEPVVKSGAPKPIEPSMADIIPVPLPKEPSHVEDHGTNGTQSPPPVAATTQKPGVRKVDVNQLPLGKVEHRAATAQGLRIGTWNVFRFGPTKFKLPDPFVKKYNKERKQMMVDQICQFDILAMQEYFDPSLVVLEALMTALDASCGKWAHAVGERVGRVSKEQYVFLYRTDVAKVLANETYPEPAGQDIFSREPFFVKFQISKPGVSLKILTLGTIHTEPDSAVEEMNGLVDTFDWAKKKFGVDEVMVLGDYNGDCQYVRKSDWPKVKLFTQTEFTWFIPTGTDTASMNSECTFDRAVTKSELVKKAFVPGSMKVLDFVSQYHIEVKEARQLSDHFPVGLLFH